MVLYFKIKDTHHNKCKIPEYFICYRTYLPGLLLSLQRIRKIVITVLQNVENKKRGKIMKTTNKNNENLIAKLQYQLQRYKAMGNGAICQSLNNRIQRLSAQQKA